MGKKRGWPGPGCLSFLIIYVTSLLVMYFISSPTETEDFSGRTAVEFTVAAFATGYPDDGNQNHVLNLEYLNAGNFDDIAYTFLLPKKEITIRAGDIHRVEILEDNDDWQLVAFYYSNSRTSTSIYRAYANRIEPVSYRVTSSVGQLFTAIFLLLPAIVLSLIIAAIFTWRARRATRSTET